MEFEIGFWNVRRMLVRVGDDRISLLFNDYYRVVLIVIVLIFLLWGCKLLLLGKEE